VVADRAARDIEVNDLDCHGHLVRLV